MTHDIDISTGGPAIAYVGAKPWHQLGEELPEGQPIEAWLKAARLDWDIKRLPVQYLVDGILMTMDDRLVLARSDTKRALSIVSSDYYIVQPKEVLEFYRDLMSDYGYVLETAGALAGGRKIWAMARTGITETADAAGKDQLGAYLLLATSYDKSLATTVSYTSIRVVCQNTLSFAMTDTRQQKRPRVKVPHNVRFDAKSIKLELGLIDEAWSDFMAIVRKMAAHPMPRQPAADFFRKLLAPNVEGQVSARIEGQLNTLNNLFVSAPGQTMDGAKDTLWGAVNAVTYYTDHHRPGSSGDRLDSSWFGSGHALKERAWAAAAELIGV